MGRLQAEPTRRRFQVITTATPLPFRLDDPLGGQEVGMKIRQTEREIADLEKYLVAR
jgi:hypothetical protein